MACPQLGVILAYWKQTGVSSPKNPIALAVGVSKSKTQNYENQGSKQNQTRKREPAADDSNEIQQHRPVFIFQQRFSCVKKSDKSKDKRQVDHCAKQGAVQWIRILNLIICDAGDQSTCSSRCDKEKGKKQGKG